MAAPRSSRLVCTAAIAVVALATLAPTASAEPVPVVSASAETPALFDDEAGGNANADDPAIWVNRKHPSRSLVVATAKEGGLRVYDLQARLVQSIAAPAAPGPDTAPGRFNNVDLLSAVRFPDGRADVAVVSDRGRDRIRVYRIDPRNAAAPLRDVTVAAPGRVFSATEAAVDDQETAYGIATYRDRRGRAYAVVSQRHRTDLALARLKVTAQGRVGYEVVRRISLPSTFRLPDASSWSPCAEPGELPQVEGMVIDPDSGTLYAGQEDVGIWRLKATLRGGRTLVDKVAEFGVPGTYDAHTEECVAGADPGFGGRHLKADVEGLTIYRLGRRGGYLLASSQGDDTFVAYSRTGSRYRSTFAVGDGSAADGSQESDGAAVTSTSLPGYPGGLLVVQDGANTPAVVDGGEERVNTDFKFVSWRKAQHATGL